MAEPRCCYVGTPSGRWTLPKDRPSGSRFGLPDGYDQPARSTVRHTVWAFCYIPLKAKSGVVFLHW